LKPSKRKTNRVVEHKVKNNQGPNPPRGASVEHPNPLPVQAISLPAAIPAYYQSEQGERPSRNTRERIKIAIEFGGFASAVVLSVLTLYTLKATREATQVANRAYLACGAPEIFGPGIKIPIQNLGHVPARILDASLTYPTVFP